MTDSPDPQIQPRRAWIPYGVLAGALLLTGVATYSAARVLVARDEMQFANGVQQTREEIERRLQIYTEILNLGSVVCGGHRDVSLEEFREYAQGLQVNRRYPGIQGIGFTRRVELAEKDNVVREMRRRGFPGFAIWPDKPETELHTILHIEPLDWRNRRAIGYNMFSESVRRAAMVQARDSGAPAASGKVVLVQETGQQVQPGFLIYVPVYRTGRPPRTVDERRRELVGFVYAPFRAGDLLRGIFASEKQLPVEFRVFDGPEPSPNALLYQSVSAESVSHRPWFRRRLQLGVAGRTWTVEFASGESLESTSGAMVVPFIGLGGLAVSLLLFRFSATQARAYAAAERNARELRRSQLALRNSEDRLRLALESADLGTWELDPRTRQTRWSARAAQLMGLPAEAEVAYDQFAHAVYAEDRAAVEHSLKRALDAKGDGHFELEFRSIAKDGVRWVSARGRAFFEDTPEGRAAARATGTILDVTHRKEVEEWNQFLVEAGRALSESLDYRRTLSSLARLAVPRLADCCAIDIVGSDGQIERLETIHRNPERAEVARRLNELYPIQPDAGDGVPGVLRYGRSEIYPQVSQEALARAAENPEHLRLLREMGVHSALLVPIRTRNRVLGALTFFYAESGRTYSDLDLPLAEALAVRAGLAVDNALLYQAAQQEIIDRKRAEHEVQRLNHELEDRVARRTAALQEINEQLEAFTYTVAHDLRAPLRAMQGFSQALLEDYAQTLGPTGADYAARVIGAAQRMDALIQDLLAYSRLSRSHLSSEPVELTPLAERVLVSLQSDLRSKQARVELTPPLPVVEGHPSTLELVLLNLVANALKFVAPGVQPHVRIWAKVGGTQAKVCVTDNGIGISADHHERIFRVFERLHGADSFPGTGIGLSIVKKGIERMGGRVGVESDAGQGSTFWFELPLAT